MLLRLLCSLEPGYSCILIVLPLLYHPLIMKPTHAQIPHISHWQWHVTPLLNHKPSADEPSVLHMQVNQGSLSAGEKQLLALARATLRCTQAIILDEATSQIDSNFDDQVWSNRRRRLLRSLWFHTPWPCSPRRPISDSERTSCLRHSKQCRWKTSASDSLSTTVTVLQIPVRGSEFESGLRLSGEHHSSFTYLHSDLPQIYLLETQFILNRFNYRAEMKLGIVLDTMCKKVLGKTAEKCVNENFKKSHVSKNANFF
jgi:hypothetical protein